MIVYSGLGILVAPVAVVGFLLPIFLEPWVKKQYGVTLPGWCVMSLAATLPFIGMLGLDFTVQEPPELIGHLRLLAERYTRACAG